MAALGSKSITAHDDTKEFIRGLEMTARKVNGDVQQWQSEALIFWVATCALLPVKNTRLVRCTYVLIESCHTRMYIRTGSHECQQETYARTPTPAELGEEA